MSSYHVGKTISSIRFLLLRNARTNISLQRRLLSNRNKLPNTCTRNNLWPSVRRLISSIEVPIRDLRVISGMWKTSVNRADWYSSRWQRLDSRRVAKSVEISRRCRSISEKKTWNVVLASLQRTLHIGLGRIDDGETTTMTLTSPTISTGVASGRFCKRDFAYGVASYFN